MKQDKPDQKKSTRTLLAPGDVIMLGEGPNGARLGEYEILSVLGEGRSSVCYDAVFHQDEETKVAGKLKEFYPVDATLGENSWYYSLERVKGGQLVPRSGTARKFEEMCREYHANFRNLRTIISRTTERLTLNRFLSLNPARERFGYLPRETKGKQAHARKNLNVGQPTVYLWMPLSVEGRDFGCYLREVRDKPEKQPDRKLLDILRVLQTLTKCIRDMHTVGLMHLDLSPANFLVLYQANLEIDTSQVSLSDIDTITEAGGLPKSAGTKGFVAPELRRGRADNRADIYSIGAMLFYGIVILKEIPDGLYRDELYPEIDQLVRHSKLMENSLINSSTRLISLISNILKKCLAADPDSRYDDCDQLLKDLARAEVIWAEEKRSFRNRSQDQLGKTEPAIVMQKLLYEHPLYESQRTAREIRVLVLGGGTYGQKFADLCLQAGQMSDHQVSISILSDAPEETRKEYLQFRPALPEFVDVEGSMASREKEAYARLDFLPLYERTGVRFSGKRESSEPLVSSLLERMEKDGSAAIDYVLVSLGSDETNQTVARLLAEDRRTMGPVCYTSWRSKKQRKQDQAIRLYPVCINESIVPENIHEHLEQMTFNTHIVWDNTLNYDRKEKWDKLRGNRYDYTSSMMFALSIRYKLHSIGIDFTDELDGAEAFKAQVLDARETDDSAKEKFERLTALEHRRWVLEKVTDGWTAPRDKDGKLLLEVCTRGEKVRDDLKRTHPCIVHSVQDAPLSREPYMIDGQVNLDKWDDPKIDSSLDELDRMTLGLHQCFKRQAEELKRLEPMESREMERLAFLTSEEDDAIIRAFQQFQYCLKNVLNGVESYARQFDQYVNALEDSVRHLDQDRKDRIKESLKKVQATFHPAIQYALHKNYKALDETLIENIPFILTYKECVSIALPFADGAEQGGKNEAVFPNVAAATVLNPARIHYLYYMEKQTKPDLSLRKLRAVLNYLNGRGIKCEIYFAAACLPDVSDQAYEAMKNGLKSIADEFNQDSAAHLADGQIFPCEHPDDAAYQFLAYLQNYDVQMYEGGTSLFRSTLPDGEFLNRVLALPDISYYEFDQRQKRFFNCKRCEYLRYIKDASHLRVQDMFALMNAKDVAPSFPECPDDYKDLWKIYTGDAYLNLPDAELRFANGVGNWNRLCDILNSHANSQLPLAEIPIIWKDQPKNRTCTYLLPRYAFTGIHHLLDRLKERELVDASSSLEGYSSDTCRLTLTTSQSIQDRLKAVFAQPHLLPEYYNIRIHSIKEVAVPFYQVVYDRMDVENAVIPGDVSRYLLQLLKKLEEMGFIRNLSWKSGENDDEEGNALRVSFLYATPRIRSLLTKAGEILEIYTYYQVLDTGYFDDVAWSYEFLWEDGGVRNEMDLVLTKGFQSFIVECKAVKKLDQNYYHKLESLAERFGIGATKILVGNTYTVNRNGYDEINARQCSLGNQMEIITESSRDAIAKIGQVLAARMKEKQMG